MKYVYFLQSTIGIEQGNVLDDVGKPKKKAHPNRPNMPIDPTARNTPKQALKASAQSSESPFWPDPTRISKFKNWVLPSKIVI